MIQFIATKWNVPNQQRYDDSVFPFAYQGHSPDADVSVVSQWLEPQLGRLHKLASLNGAVLFRDFPVRSAEDFDVFIRALGIENFPYKESLSNAVRTNFTERVFSANEAPSAVNIFLHHEMAQTPLFPNFIMFFCELAAESGGATPICRSDILYERCVAEVPALIQELTNKGLRYTNVMANFDDANSGMGRSWQSTLGVQSKADAESRLSQLGYAWEWRDGDCLKATTPVLPAVREVAHGRKTLFNQLIAAYSGWQDERNDLSQAIRLGDETPLNSDEVATLIALADEITFPLEWQSGDVAFIDNTMVMHGRSPFEGQRRVLASLGNMQTHAFQASSSQD